MSTYGAIVSVTALYTPLRSSPRTHDAGLVELEWVHGRHADGGSVLMYSLTSVQRYDFYRVHTITLKSR